ncbi:MAG: SUMF1/EgtB/PvdO family nonheme iron enzyme, partial [Anaerolineales bacterium]|nr:SUMF1/EgtB/PvdO family nonheme iron enzyme [Anaerolineales bacterium]
SSETPLPSSTPTLFAGASRVSPADGMTQLWVPAGPFEMGSLDGFDDERPVHAVDLDGFWIDQTEVSLAQFERFQAASGYVAAPCAIGGEHPVACVDWAAAQAYCQWAGRRLPTEAEWEKAARGTDGRPYPWGSQAPDCGRAHTYECLTDLAQEYPSLPAGSLPAGASPYGALDMAGNVWEWVADWYGEDYYTVSPPANPTGPASGQLRVVRGGGWSLDVLYIRSAHRGLVNPAGTFASQGFRCAQSGE